ncbi:class I SAM-dependent methyltransferase (plasmid) [Deinococcus sp. KNUC1210]|uniref:class I SAM-dependent methyltransferase n=1 Tax=Deinococcus sp. KNUC1210 TaxID=2917691 RepID=UPI001EF0419E|nr:class I SAM-dependent methyltransferase [Deinococcus sp. KNUC1210]ULH17988.1 class I SAM-dependent methyltransferase [Deinococcus sp. KNUC1210]
MSDESHSREWYARLAQQQDGYRHPWQRTMDAPDPELTFDALLMTYLHPDVQVLEAGCGHGPDAVRFGRDCARWVAYDFQPLLLNQARQHAPHAEFHLWDGKGDVPPGLRGPFDLIVSRRGPTSVIRHLPSVAAPGATFLYVGPRLEVPQVPERLQQVGWEIVGESRVCVQAYTPSWEDWQLRCQFMGEHAEREEWESKVTGRGMPYKEERYIVIASPMKPTDRI